MRRAAAVLACAALLVSACGEAAGEAPMESEAETGYQGGAVPTATVVTASLAARTPAPLATRTTAPRPLVLPTVGSFVGLPANELGWIPILQYHHIDFEKSLYSRTPAHFREDLRWLYRRNFYVVNVHDYLDGTMNVPAGKHPVILTFDDGAATQFRLNRQRNGQLEIDPETAVGIMEQFFQQHPDFGRGGHFAIIPDRTFAWSNDRPQDKHQFQYATTKLEWLLANGYEIGNHTLEHADLSTLAREEIEFQIAEAQLEIEQQCGCADVRVLTLPYGGYPSNGDDAVFRGFSYEGRTFTVNGVLLVGANPAAAPISKRFNPYAIPRIQAFDQELDRWFDYFEENPEVLYTSDGNPETVTVPAELHQALVGTLDIGKIGDLQLVRN